MYQRMGFGWTQITKLRGRSWGWPVASKTVSSSCWWNVHIIHIWKAMKIYAGIGRGSSSGIFMLSVDNWDGVMLTLKWSPLICHLSDHFGFAFEPGIRGCLFLFPGGFPLFFLQQLLFSSLALLTELPQRILGTGRTHLLWHHGERLTFLDCSMGLIPWVPWQNMEEKSGHQWSTHESNENSVSHVPAMCCHLHDALPVLLLMFWLQVFEA